MNSPSSVFSGIVMAGGRSTRMGRDKALLELANGQTLLEHAVETLRTLGAAEVIVSVAREKSYRLDGTREVQDIQADCGPIGGLQACLVAASQPLCVVLAVDVPAMTTEYLHELLEACSPGCGMVPMNDGSAEPLVAVYPKGAAAEATYAVQARNFSLQRLIRGLEQKKLVRLRTVSSAERPLFANWNSPEDCR